MREKSLLSVGMLPSVWWWIFVLVGPVEALVVDREASGEVSNTLLMSTNTNSSDKQGSPEPVPMVVQADDQFGTVQVHTMLFQDVSKEGGREGKRNRQKESGRRAEREGEAYWWQFSLIPASQVHGCHAWWWYIAPIHKQKHSQRTQNKDPHGTAQEKECHDWGMKDSSEFSKNPRGLWEMVIRIFFKKSW